MRQQDQRTDQDERTDADGRHRPRYPEGTGDQGPDALDERGSYDNDLATTEPGPTEAASTKPRPTGPGSTGSTERAEFHEPAPLPTSFGAPTVGGAVAAAALAGSHHDPREEDTVRPGDGQANDRIDGVGDEPARTGTPPTARQGSPDRSLGAADATAAVRTEPAAGDGAQPDSPVDPFGQTRPDSSAGSTAVGRAHPVNPDIFSAGNPDTLIGTTSAAENGSGRITSTDAKAGDEPQTGGRSESAAGARTADDGPPAGTAPTEPIATILDADAVQGFRDRWREVQLRFVDDPPGATADAQRLVEESVEAVTAALTRQRDDLGGWQRDGDTDTERLRMVVRRHRDFLDRLLGR